MATLAEVLVKMRRPLEFASKNDFAALPKIEGLEKTIGALVLEGLDSERDPGRKELLREIKILFLEFDAESPSEKRRKLTAAIELLVTLEKMCGVTPPILIEEPAGAPIPMPPAEPTDPRVPLAMTPAWAVKTGEGKGDGEDEDGDGEEEP